MIHIKQIDGLRCVAIGMVLATHWGLNKLLSVSVPLAPMGVNLFFVISGFLITLILLDLKEIKVSQNITLFHLLKTFYIRRSLRIFPIYYLSIFAAMILGIEPIYNIWVWLLTYSLNLGDSFATVEPGIFGIYWSLAVEEQFYLFFPLVILVIPKKYLTKLFWLMIVSAVIARFIFNQTDLGRLTEGVVSYQFTLCCLDTFGFGALLAFFFKYSKKKLSVFLKKYFWLAIVSLVLFFLIEFSVEGFSGSTTLGRLFFSATCFGIIGYASLGEGFTGIIGRFLENPVIVYLGKISYGIYVYHIFVGRFFYTLPLSFLESHNALGHPLGVSIENIYLKTFLRFAVTILVAAISWHFFELPINRLKNKFPYSRKD